MQGLAINLLNPKIIIFFMTFLPQFVQPSDPHASGKLLFLGVMFVVIALPFTVPMILAASNLTQLAEAQSARHARHRLVVRERVRRVCGDDLD